MPIHFARRLTGHKRSVDANKHLGVTLAFIAGAINAGGFLAVQQYTSHMTGIVSSMADHLALQNHAPVLAGFGAILSFLLGAACTALLVSHARQRRMHSEYALPLLLEAVLLLGFGLLGGRLATIGGLFVPLTVMLLCFIMGLQNALITKLSRAEIRTTHMTGIITDIGIELGKLAYRRGAPGADRVMVNRDRLRVHAMLLLSFFLGGVTGALGFTHIGYRSTVPLAVVLCVLAIVPALDDLARLRRRRARK
ncbi:YoaK family protein [Massilia sp.]|uniref:YoaK family protein n=1 Tax=Massilia sp. TaxID=1882437 RepID=UPI00391A26C7